MYVIELYRAFNKQERRLAILGLVFFALAGACHAGSNRLVNDPPGIASSSVAADLQSHRKFPAVGNSFPVLSTKFPVLLRRECRSKAQISWGY